MGGSHWGGARLLYESQKEAAREESGQRTGSTGQDAGAEDADAGMGEPGRCAPGRERKGISIFGLRGLLIIDILSIFDEELEGVFIPNLETDERKYWLHRG